MIWVDASIWLEIALDQEDAERCIHFLEGIGTETLYTSDFDVYSVILTMLRYKKTKEEIRIVLGSLSGLRTITIFRPPLDVLLRAIEDMSEKKLTFDDALAYACMKYLKTNTIATLDHDFRKLGVRFAL